MMRYLKYMFLLGIFLYILPLSLFADKFEKHWWDNFSLSLELKYDEYKDLEIVSRSYKYDNINLGFAQNTLKAQNKAEEKNWIAFDQVLKFNYHLKLTHNTTWKFSVGVGRTDVRAYFNEKKIEQDDIVYVGDIDFELFNISYVKLSLLGEYFFASTETEDLNIISGSEEEKLKYDWNGVNGGLVFSIDIPHESTLVLSPYFGAKYQAIKLDETFTVTMGGVSSKLVYKTETEDDSSIRGILGVRLEWRYDSELDFQIQAGDGVIGGMFTFVQYF